MLHVNVVTRQLSAVLVHNYSVTTRVRDNYNHRRVWIGTDTRNMNKRVHDVPTMCQRRYSMNPSRTRYEPVTACITNTSRYFFFAKTHKNVARIKIILYLCSVFRIRLVIAAFRKSPNLFRQQNARTRISPPCAGYSSCFCWVFGDTLERRLK